MVQFLQHSSIVDAEKNAREVMQVSPQPRFVTFLVLRRVYCFAYRFDVCRLRNVERFCFFCYLMDRSVDACATRLVLLYVGVYVSICCY